MAYNTKQIVKDKDGNPISQYYNPVTDQYEPVEGNSGGNKVVVQNNDLSLIPILEKLSQLTGTVIDEETRKANEIARQSNETLRINAETSRKNAENIRVTSEKDRVTKETDRVAKETIRVDAEKVRVSNETARQSNETERNSNENIRKSNETVRISNENLRVDLYDDLLSKVASGYFKGEKGDTGNGLEFYWRGTDLGVRVKGDTDYVYVNIKGEKGDTGSIENLTKKHVTDALGYTPVDDIKVGSLTSLTTLIKTNVVNAINSLKGEIDVHKADYTRSIKEDFIRIGNNPSAIGGVGTIAIGTYSKANDGGVSLGRSTVSLGEGIAIGYMAKNTKSRGVAIGYATEVAKFSVAIGSGSSAINDNQGVLGDSGIISNWHVPGSFTVNGTKNFEIPHPKPSKKATHVIRHGAVESPSAGDTLYRYKVKATKENDIQTIGLPDYFIHLNKDVQIFVTPQNHFGSGYGNLNRDTEQLEIHCELPGEYNILVIGTRNDDHQSVRNWDTKGVEREIGQSWDGETYVFEVDEITEIEEITRQNEEEI